MELLVGTSGYPYKFRRGTFDSEMCKEAEFRDPRTAAVRAFSPIAPRGL